MPLLADDLSVWDISFRLAGHDPRKLWFAVIVQSYDGLINVEQVKDWYKQIADTPGKTARLAFYCISS